MPAIRTTALIASAAATLMVAGSGCGSASKKESTAASAQVTPTTGTSSQTTPVSAKPFPVANVQIAKGKALSHQQWAAKAERICAHYHTEIKSLKINSFAELPRVLPQVAIYVHEEVHELAKLTPPQANSKDWQQLLNTMMEWAQGSAKLAEYRYLGVGILKSPVGTAFLATHQHVVTIAQHNHLKRCAR